MISDSPAHRYPPQPPSQNRRPFTRCRFCFLFTYQSEVHGGARSELPQSIQVGSDDVGHLRVAADRLAVHAQDNGPAIVGDLYRAGRDRLGHELATR